MDSLDVFRTLARYNKVANARLYEQCGKLELAEYRRERPGSFGSIHALLNHTLLALSYRNSLGKDCTDSALHAVLHFFNHQTHHRGQVHVMLSQTDVRPPSLDMHRILNP
jgi:uncharacterized damage-inducible protein DinB